MVCWHCILAILYKRRAHVLTTITYATTSAFAHHVHVHIMTEVEPFSERQTPPDDNSGQGLRGDGENRPLDPAAVVSSTILPATGSERAEVTDPSIDINDPSDVSQLPTEKPPGRCDLDTDDSKKGVKRSREIEPMDHSGNHLAPMIPDL